MLKKWLLAAVKSQAVVNFSLKGNLAIFYLSPAASKSVRSPRPPFVFLRVGEVVMERRGAMVGVVVSWDPEMRAPSEWVDQVYANSEVSDRTSGRETPPLCSPMRFHDSDSILVLVVLRICTRRRPKQKRRLIIKFCSAVPDLLPSPSDTCLRLNCSASLESE